MNTLRKKYDTLKKTNNPSIQLIKKVSRLNIQSPSKKRRKSTLKQSGIYVNGNPRDSDFFINDNNLHNNFHNNFQLSQSGEYSNGSPIQIPEIIIVPCNLEKDNTNVYTINTNIRNSSCSPDVQCSPFKTPQESPLFKYSF